MHKASIGCKSACHALLHSEHKRKWFQSLTIKVSYWFLTDNQVVDRLFLYTIFLNSKYTG